MQQILVNASSGESSVVDLQGGHVEVAVAGDFGGGSVKLMCELKGTGTYIPVSDNGEAAVWTEPLVKRFTISKPCKLKLVIDGAVTSINAWM